MTAERRVLRVAIVGAGPSGMYAAGHLLRQHEVTVEVDVFDRLPTPWGLVRNGVAPDHPEKKGVTRVFELTAAIPGFRFFGNVEIGRDLQAAELRDWYDAVIYAYGAAASRPAGVPGSDLPGCGSATDFVNWYNGHPDHSGRTYDFSTERAVIIGNGNVALDVARILSLSCDELKRTDIAGHALEALSRSRIREVVVMGRRGPQYAAFNNPELAELGHLEGVDVSVGPDGVVDEAIANAGGLSWEARRKLETLRSWSARQAGPARRIRLQFLATPVEVVGDRRCEAIRFEHNQAMQARREVQAPSSCELLETGLVLFAIGFRGCELPGVPFDSATGTVPHQAQRVKGLDRGGTYVTGWIARGPSGIIGSNKLCAHRAVDALFEDFRSGRIGTDRVSSAREVADVLQKRSIGVVSYRGWQSIDEAELSAGAGIDRPRLKRTDWSELLATARPQGL